jgi:hypothetical protein
MSNLVCNFCSNPAEGIAYRSNCCHFFCPACANTHFSTESHCPICRTQLYDGDVIETTVGMPCTTMLSQLFQAALSNTSWDQIHESMATIHQNVSSLDKFVHGQLYLQACKAAAERDKLAEQLRIGNHQMVGN